MALFRAGCYPLKSFTPVLTSPGFMIPSSVNCQVRNAARKGYREKRNRKKLADKKKSLEDGLPKSLERWTSKSKLEVIRKTENLKKPEPPNDDIFITNNFNYKKYTLAEAVQFHKEYHHPTVFNNPEAPIIVRFDIDMTGKKLTQVIKPFSSIAAIKYPFVIKNCKEVIVFCHPEDEQMCLECGASIAGGANLIKKVQEGLILPSSFDHVIADASMFPQLVTIRGLLKDQLPRAKKGNLTTDLKSAIAKFLHGIEYSCVKYESDHNFGVISAGIGKIDMPVEHLEENFKSLMEDIMNYRPSEERAFITWAWCFSPPSDEKFAIDLSKYLPQMTKSKVNDKKIVKNAKPENVENEEEGQEKENKIETKN